jgi:hypothetical protein
MTEAPSRAPAWALPAGAALGYLTALAVVFAREAEWPGTSVVVTFLIAALAGFAVEPLGTPLVAAALAAGLLVCAGAVDEDVPLVVTVGGLVAGAALARAPAGLGSDAPAKRWAHAKRLLRPVVNRTTFEAIDDALDRFRFRIDTLPNGLYQPVRGLPVRAARTTGSESRWQAMQPVILRCEARSALDIGACEGYFALELAALGIPAIAVESEPSNYRTALLAARRNGDGRVGVLALEVTPENVSTLPAADCVLCLSIWHHFVRSHGVAVATGMLEEIWGLARQVLLFDTGENEMTPDFELPPMTPEPRSWLAAYLAQTCAGGTVEHLGLHRAFAPGGAPCNRNLFAVLRG